MSSHVHLKTAHLIKLSTADVAPIWLLSGMLPEVNDQTTLLVKTSTANLAIIRLFARMTSHMYV